MTSSFESVKAAKSEIRYPVEVFFRVGEPRDSLNVALSPRVVIGVDLKTIN